MNQKNLTKEEIQLLRQAINWALQNNFSNPTLEIIRIDDKLIEMQEDGRE